jgi:GMP synthase-like glutamine amidotransferase
MRWWWPVQVSRAGFSSSSRYPEFNPILVAGHQIAYSAYETHPWLTRLIEYIKTLSTSPEYARLKIIGICFGMQVLAMALGGPGAVTPNSEGWEIGVYEVELTELGRDWFRRAQQKQEKKGPAGVDESSERVVEHVVETKTIVSVWTWSKDVTDPIFPDVSHVSVNY